MEVWKGGISPYDGGGRVSEAAGEPVPFVRGLNEGEKRPRGGKKEFGVPELYP